ncbi:MAG: SH3 domain-containing protein [Clostridiales bacterium]|nr:SH3 domain-containing protein [Clostridiales bacterium]
MIKKQIKRSIAILLAVITIFSAFGITSFAHNTTAYNKINSSSVSYAKTYTISTSGRTIPYTSTSLSTRGTVTYGKSSGAYIDNAADEIYVYSVGKNSSGTYYAKVTYPSGNKRLTAYIALSAISSGNGSNKSVTSTGKFYCAKRYGNSTSSSYYVAKGDTVYLLATNGSWYQILYPTSGSVWRIAWCKQTDYNKYCGSSTKTTYNDVFASSKGKGYSHTQALASEKTSFTKGDYIYVWGMLHDGSKNLYETYSSGKCNMTLSVYKPDGSCKFTYTYSNCCCNWIGVSLDVAGTWKIQSKVTGALTGTNTRTITVTNGSSGSSSSTSTKTYTGYVNTSSAPLVLRKSASTSSSAITNMPKGSSLTVLDNKAQTNGFYHVTYNGKTGYASASYISFTKPTTGSTSTSSKITFSYSNSKTGYTTSSSSKLVVNGTTITVGSTFYTYNSNGSGRTTAATSGYTYAKVGSKYVNMNGWQCCAYARYIQYLLYGCQDFSSNKFTSISAAKGATATASSIKTWVNTAGVGAHIRSSRPHSLIVIGIDNNGFYYTDANVSGTNQIRVGYYTWSGFASSSFKNIESIKYYKG